MNKTGMDDPNFAPLHTTQKWKPAEDEGFWYLNAMLEPTAVTPAGIHGQNVRVAEMAREKMLLVGNCYPTEEAARAAITNIHNAMNLHPHVYHDLPDLQAITHDFVEHCKKVAEREEIDGWYPDFQLEVFIQMWGSTALGFGGIGGQAMTNAYTTVIWDNSLGVYAVYFANRPAYTMWSPNQIFFEHLRDRNMNEVAKWTQYVRQSFEMRLPVEGGNGFCEKEGGPHKVQNNGNGRLKCMLCNGTVKIADLFPTEGEFEVRVHTSFANNFKAETTIPVRILSDTEWLLDEVGVMHPEQVKPYCFPVNLPDSNNNP
jgi:hypothetical protein